MKRLVRCHLRVKSQDVSYLHTWRYIRTRCGFSSLNARYCGDFGNDPVENLYTLYRAIIPCLEDKQQGHEDQTCGYHEECPCLRTGCYNGRRLSHLLTCKSRSCCGRCCWSSRGRR